MGLRGEWRSERGEPLSVKLKGAKALDRVEEGRSEARGDMTGEFTQVAVRLKLSRKPVFSFFSSRFSPSAVRFPSFPTTDIPFPSRGTPLGVYALVTVFLIAPWEVEVDKTFGFFESGKGFETDIMIVKELTALGSSSSNPPVKVI